MLEGSVHGPYPKVRWALHDPRGIHPCPTEPKTEVGQEPYGPNDNVKTPKMLEVQLCDLTLSRGSVTNYRQFQVDRRTHQDLSEVSGQFPKNPWQSLKPKHDEWDWYIYLH